VRRRLAVPILAAAVVLAACGGGDPAPEVPTVQAPETGFDPPDERPGLGPDDDVLELPRIVDDTLRAEGVVLPVPEGWSVDETAFAQGLVGVSPGGEPPSQLLIASGAIESDPVFGVEGLSYDEILEAFAGLVPEGPAVDEEVQIEGAERARLLRYNQVEMMEGQEPTDEVLLLVDAGGGQVALFNYAAPSAIFDEEVLQLLLDEAALDPDHERTPGRP
jgi:hypothetical protein